jgi:outer membrane scaffolding protein for murein synthesis (MipA/OmpV family)
MRFYRCLAVAPAWCALAVLAVACVPAQAQRPEDDQGLPPEDFELAVGVRTSHQPEYLGADKSSFGAAPAIYLRLGAITLSSAPGLIDRSDNEVLRGVAVNLQPTERLRVALALRFDEGRSGDDKGDLRTIADVDQTIRLRAALQYRFDHGWQASAIVTPDVLSRGGGVLVEIGGGREQRIVPSLLWQYSAGVSWGSRTYMSSYFGVDPAQSQSSGLPGYAPASGFRNVGLGTRLRWTLDDHWTVSVAASVSRLVGPAAASPLALDRQSFSLGAGVLYWIWR